MSPERPNKQRTRFRRPLGVAVMAYKAALGLSELLVGVLLAVPGFDPQATFARLSAEELPEDPDDRVVALVSRHLPALLHHRGLVAVGLAMLGLAKLVAAAAIWEGHEWGGYLLAATVAMLLPFDCARPWPTPPGVMSCWPWPTRLPWRCWSCSYGAGCLVGHSWPDPTAARRHAPGSSWRLPASSDGHCVLAAKPQVGFL
jgi:uncharacterized membrane protein (DUF2068 family)